MLAGTRAPFGHTPFGFRLCAQRASIKATPFGFRLCAQRTSMKASSQPSRSGTWRRLGGRWPFWPHSRSCLLGQRSSVSDSARRWTWAGELRMP
eukprot:8700797-Alexandrium_andersonii.AAC.1